MRDVEKAGNQSAQVLLLGQGQAELVLILGPGKWKTARAGWRMSQKEAGWPLPKRLSEPAKRMRLCRSGQGWKQNAR